MPDDFAGTEISVAVPFSTRFVDWVAIAFVAGSALSGNPFADDASLCGVDSSDDRSACVGQFCRGTGTRIS